MTGTVQSREMIMMSKRAMKLQRIINILDLNMVIIIKVGKIRLERVSVSKTPQTPLSVDR